MGWFDEQIRERIEKDGEAFSEVLEQMAGAVMGRPAFADQMNSRAKQSEDAIEEVLRYYHIKPAQVPPQVTDVSDRLRYQLRPHGVMYRAVTLRERWYRDGAGIMMGSTTRGDIIVLRPYGMGRYRYLDRQTGRYVTVNRKNKEEINREAICFYRPFPLERMDTGAVIRYLVHGLLPGELVLIAFAALFAALLGLITPKVNSLIFSRIAPLGETGPLIAAISLLVCTAFAIILLQAFQAVLTARIQTRMDLSVEAAMMMRVLSLPVDFFKRYTPGDIGSRMDCMGILCTLICEAVFSAGLGGVFSLVSISQIARYAPPLALPCAAVLAVQLLCSVGCALYQMKREREKLLLDAREQGLIVSMISGAAKIKLAGAEKRFFAKWAREFVKSAKLKYSPPAILKYQAVLTAAVNLLATAAFYMTAAQQGVSPASYMAFQSAYAMLSGALLALTQAALRAAQIQPVLELVKPILEAVPEADGAKTVVSRLSGRIELSHVCFRYADDMPLVIDDLSLTIRPGQYVAIVGGTGCGKSTLMRLMLGFERPGKGAVYYDGKDLLRLDLKSVREKIGVVMQDGKLFQGDIYSNITIAAPRLSVEDAWEAAQLAGIAQDIREMPMGMNTLISEGTGGVSGGQRQRLLIARAVASKPKILMFDEATSALDNVTQKLVSQSLEKLNCTRIVIAHRLSTIKQCDRIVVLDHGKIVEDGTYDALMKQGGFFAGLVARQMTEPV